MTGQRWTLDDGEGGEAQFFSAAPGEEEAAARELIERDWQLTPEGVTWWATAWIAPADDPHERRRIWVAVDPEEPECPGEEDHAWRQVSLTGHGGGVILTDACESCCLRRVTDTWAHCPETGVQGLESIRYVEDES